MTGLAPWSAAKTVAALLFCLLPTAAARMPQVDRFVEDSMTRHLVPGLAVVIIIPLSNTATAVMQRVDDGTINIDAPMQQHLTEPAVQRSCCGSDLRPPATWPALRAPTLGWATTPDAPVPGAVHRGAAQAHGFSRAMGWREGPTAGVRSLWHGGAVPSYRGAVVLLPESKSAVIVLTNASTVFGDHTREIAAGIVALLEERPLPTGIRPLRTTYAAICHPVCWVHCCRLFLNLVVPLAVFLAVPGLMKVSPREMWEAEPDTVTTVGVVLLLGRMTGVVKLRRLGQTWNAGWATRRPPD
jgi:hypothetical protein